MVHNTQNKKKELVEYSNLLKKINTVKNKKDENE